MIKILSLLQNTQGGSINLEDNAVLKALSTPTTTTQATKDNTKECAVDTFDEDLEEELIEHVKLYPMIWNVTLKEYKDAGKKSLLWQRISTNLKINGKLNKIFNYIFVICQ